MWRRFVPWKYLISRLAKAGGFIDPVRLLFRLEAFSQPMDLQVPLEMLRSGMVFHARGFMNTIAIQHNLDWIWPYWVERQYNPLDVSFIPRSFLLTHINITHRNWTAVGLPDCDSFCIVDPRGLLTPFWDSWSIDAWVVSMDGKALYPSQTGSSAQHLDLESGIAVVTESCLDGMDLSSRIEVSEVKGIPTCVMSLKAASVHDSWLAISVRPYNPEGVSFINTISRGKDPSTLVIDQTGEVRFDPFPNRTRFSYYRHGDVHTRIFQDQEELSVTCKVGMATAAVLYPIEKGGSTDVQVSIPLKRPSTNAASAVRYTNWDSALSGRLSISIPEKRFQELFEGASRVLVLLSPGETVYPGPYTYKRFWFRDAAFILHALMCLRLFDRVEKVIDSFPGRQDKNGFFLSQEGEWDSNGEALWTMNRYCQLSGRPPKPAWLGSIINGAEWIIHKRLPIGTDDLHAGLLPPGFSAEHLGPNDYYYWDDFWGVAGLRAAADLLHLSGNHLKADNFRHEADLFLKAIESSLDKISEHIGRPAMPASPYRRLDSGAVGSLVAGYPLQIFPANDKRLIDTASFLFENCLVNDGFFLDIIHSGINPYLSLHLSQVFMRAGRMRFLDLIRTVADLASPTGQWPEAIHPGTLGGCMGDGDHAWAAAEWVLALRNCFVREEGNKLFIGCGIMPSWYRKNDVISLGPAPTIFGDVSVKFKPMNEGLEVSWDAAWRKCPPAIEVSVPGFDSIIPGPEDRSVLLTWKGEP